MTFMKLISLYIVLCSFAYSSYGQNKTNNIQLDGFEDFVKQTLLEWEVKGVAIAIVGKDTLLYAEGFGFRGNEKNLPIRPQTTFPVASIAKPLIALSIALLESDGLIEINKPINKYLGDIEFSDSNIQSSLTFKDLILHRSGYARHEEIWHLSSLPRKELISNWSNLTPEKPLRDLFQYSEMSYHLLCYLVDEISETSWEEYVANRIFMPLGFQHSSFGSSGLTHSSNFSDPFIKLEDSIKQVGVRRIGVAGAVNSSVLDLSRLLQLFLNQGSLEDQQILPQTAIEQLIEPRIAVPGYKNRNGFTASYGYGWIVGNYRDHRIIEHNGQTEGFSGWLSFLPEEEIGIVVLTNNDYSPLSTIVKNNILDRILKLSQIDYNAEFLNKKAR